ncbi:isopentenyl-diphosphate delta-isomerase [Talaromyces proteolyticus]|uniref:isopentenyl-diphosphate Delta-isomerase n=1 Tax=Talaromyces proteolyticus TaxID=1131652 RepID=A0AAD4KFR1_9EURO|nr:isopentenyl-diphosphate delta-isomerase [Talaromyces proteolyticus]KAH8689306.1 isopentenyl-diphosphate delta-isomerase [Talaromyces proteolyticus]
MAEINVRSNYPDRPEDVIVSGPYDEEQVRLMDEVCILVDEDNNPIGTGSKRYCHLINNINQGILHRGFSVYLFDSKNRLLLQQRASSKITFPGVWSNTCCSHPLNNTTEKELDTKAAIQGVKYAAQRKLFHELGISNEKIRVEAIHFLTRLYYKAPADDVWGEHEIGYALLVQSDVDLHPNTNEVQNTRYVTEMELREMLNDPHVPFSPWFRLVCLSKLFSWWKYIRMGLIENIINDMAIHRMDDPEQEKGKKITTAV